MEKSQFRFCLGVGIALIVLGSAIASLASTGISLMVLGLVIIGTSFWTKTMIPNADNQPTLVPIKVSKLKTKASHR